VLQLLRCDETRSEGLCVINLIHQNSGSFVVSSPSFFVGAGVLCPILFSTSKWIRSWYGRKRRNQRKALGILAIKTEVGDPTISASTGALLDIQPQAQPIGPAKENIPVAAKVTRVADTGSLNTLRPSRSPSAPSRRYAPYTNSKTAITTATSFPSSDEVQLKLQDNQPSAEPLHSDSISKKKPFSKVPFSLVPINNNEGSAMSQLQDHGSNSLYALSAYPDGPPSFSYPAAYNPVNFIHEALPSSINLLPGFDMINNNTAQNCNIDDSMPLHIPTPVQYVHTSYGPPVNTSLMDMDDSAFISFADGSQSLRRPEVIVIDVERSSEFQQHLSHSLTDMKIDMKHHSSHGHVPFAYLRQEEGEEEEGSLSQATGEAEKTVGIPPSSYDFSAFETHLMAPIHQPQAGSPKSQFTFPSSDTHSTLSHFPATLLSTHAPTLENNYGTTPENLSPRSSLHQYETNISFGHTQSSLSPSHQPYLSMHTPAPTLKNSSPNDIDDINSELSTGSDLVSLTLRALATEEDTFTAAIMLVVLSKAGFIWDY
jgi:hypothetical protein